MSLIFAFARGFTWFARGSLFYCVLLNAIVEKNSQFAIIRLSHLKSVLRYVNTINKCPRHASSVNMLSKHVL